jgi:phosphohistidine phosphatase
MRTLYLLRHAKSAWNDPHLDDHDRPLAPRGERAAQRIAEHLEQKRIRPALVVCSTAQRARGTLDAVAPCLGKRAQVRIDGDLYGADARDLLQLLRAVTPKVTSVMLIGHNPGLQDLAIALTDDGDRRAVEQLRAKFPTAALATIDLAATEWKDLAPASGYLESVVLPREL